MKKLINICGTGRSGSTMLDLMLGNDPRAFSLGEVCAWFRPFRTHHFNIICSCGQNNCPWNQLKHFREEEFYQKCFETLDVDILVDSSKNLPWVIDNNIREKQNGTVIYNLLLYKDPISFYHSYWKRGVSVQNARTSVFIKYYKRFFETNLSFVSINYNKLVAKPADTIKKTCNILEIPYFEGKERFWEKEHHHIFGSMGTRRQAERSQSKIKAQEDFPFEFEKIIHEIQRDDEKNKRFQSILLKLKCSELGQYNNSATNVKKPFWYYLIKLKQKIRKRFPENWKYDQ